MASTSSFESLTSSTSPSEPLMASTCSSESECAEFLIVYWIVHPLNSFIISAWMSEEIHLSIVTFASLFCALIVTGGWNKVSEVTLLTLHSASYSSTSMTLLTSYWRFLLDNGVPWRWLWSSIESKIFVKYSSLAVVMHDLSYNTSSLSKSFLPHSNTLTA